ncbi:MAG TPA: polysaccharide deacetylase family protein [Longimicrobiales bacterium]|nr:polysaccharide deacetylase family protein [Longimicrobiales bacterium]
MRAILTYHSIDDSGSPISLPEDVFRRHVEWLAGAGPRVVSIEDLLALPGTEPAVAITFDDAFVNFADTAWPVLRDHALPVTLYIPTAHAGRTNAWGGHAEPGIPELPILDWNRLARLMEEGVVPGSHTRTHPRLARLPANAVQDELESSAREISSKLGMRPAGLAYPYGSCSAAVAATAARLFDHACTVDLRPLGARENRHMLPRLDMHYFRRHGMLESWGRSSLKLYLRARAGGRRCRTALNAVRGA